MIKVEDILKSGDTYSRADLMTLVGVSDRAIRKTIRQLRRNGIPIIALKDGGYKIAETDAERRELLNMNRHRAMDELVTYSRLAKALNTDGQMSFADFIVGITEVGA